MKRDFDEIDRSDFREAAFRVIRDYSERTVGATSVRSLPPPSHARLSIARDHGAAHITVHGRRENLEFGDVSYSLTEYARPKTANGMFTVEADEYDLYLSSMMDFGGQRERPSPEAASEQLWESFLEQAGVTSD